MPGTDINKKILESFKSWIESPLARDLGFLFCVASEQKYIATGGVWQEALGWSEHELTELSWSDLVHPEDVPGVSNAWAYAAQGVSIPFRVRTRKKDGSWAMVEWRGKVYDNLAYAIGSDVTEIDRLEKRQLDGERQFSLSAMAGLVAHELNNPLAVLAAKLDVIRLMMAKGELTECDIRDNCEDFGKALNRIIEIVAGFQRWGQQPAREVEGPSVPLSQALKEVHDLYRQRLEVAGVQWKIDSGLEKIRVRGGETFLFQIFSNLTSNALDALPVASERWISVSAEVEGSFVKVRFVDSGKGIAPSIRAQIFNPFFSTKKDGAFGGLGLMIVKELIQRIGGSVEIESDQPNTTFLLTLPTVSGSVLKPQLPRTTADNAQIDPELGKSRGRVLLIDDEIDLARALGYYFEQNGYEVSIASSGDEAMRLLMGSTWDIVVSDYRLDNGQTGQHLLDASRKLGHQMPWILLSGYHLELEPTLRGQFQLVLQKPVSPKVLVEQVEKILRATELAG